MKTLRSAGGSDRLRRTSANHRPDALPRVEVIDDLEVLESLTPQWQRLLLASGSGSAFATPAAVLMWYRYTASRADAYIVTVWDHDELVGIAPFSVTRLGPFQLFSTAGAEHGFTAEPLFAGDSEQVAQVVADHLSKLVASGMATVKFRKLLSNGTMASVLRSRHDVACQWSKPSIRSLVRFNDVNVEDYFRKVARKRDVPRCLRRLTEDFGPVEYVPQVPDPDEAITAMVDMLRHRFGSDAHLPMQFTRELVRRLIDVGHARVSSLVAGGQRVVISMDLQTDSHLFGYFIAHDHRLAKYGLGNINLHECLRHAYAKGVVEVDLGTAKYDYKRHWATLTVNRQTVVVHGTGLAVPVARALHRVALGYRERRFSDLVERH